LGKNPERRQDRMLDAAVGISSPAPIKQTSHPTNRQAAPSFGVRTACSRKDLGVPNAEGPTRGRGPLYQETKEHSTGPGCETGRGKRRKKKCRASGSNDAGKGVSQGHRFKIGRPQLDDPPLDQQRSGNRVGTTCPTNRNLRRLKS